MRLLVLSAADIERALPMAAAVETMKDTFAAFSRGDSEVPQRLAVASPERDGVTLVKPARTPLGLGAKLVSVFPRNRELGRPVTPGLMALLDPETGEPAAILDGTYLTALRTGAASGAATDLLARRDARVAAVIGSGDQARTQALAVDAVRRLDELRVYSPTRAHRERFVNEMGPRLGAAVTAAASAREAVTGAEIVCTATTSEVPVLDGDDLAPGCHINGVGSFTPRMRELDATTVRRASLFVDARSAARAEAGELIAAWRAGLTAPEFWTELGEVVESVRPGRRSGAEITLFKSVGIAAQDVDAAARAVGRARELGLGRRI